MADIPVAIPVKLAAPGSSEARPDDVDAPSPSASSQDSGSEAGSPRSDAKAPLSRQNSDSPFHTPSDQSPPAPRRASRPALASSRQAQVQSSTADALARGLRSLLSKGSPPPEPQGPVIQSQSASGIHVSASWQRARNAKGISPSSSSVFSDQGSSGGKPGSDTLGAGTGPRSRGGSPHTVRERGMRMPGSSLWPPRGTIWPLSSSYFLGRIKTGLPSNNSLAAAFVSASFLTAALASILSSWLLCHRGAPLADVAPLDGDMRITPFEAHLAQASLRALGADRGMRGGIQGLSGHSETRKIRSRERRKSEKWWVEQLAESGRWRVQTSFKGVPGASVASDTLSFACILVLEKACHFWLPNQHSSGFWYSLHKGANLSKLATLEDVCGHSKRAIPAPFSRKKISSIKQSTEKTGVFLSETEYSKVIKSAKVSVVDEGQGGGSAAGKAKRREMLRRHRGDRAFLAPHDSFIGHFVERVGSLSEVSLALSHSLQGEESLLRNVKEDLGGGLGTVVLFANDARVSHFASNVSQLVYGVQSGVSTVPGRDRESFSHECFSEAIFTLNAVYSEKSVRAFKRRIQSWLVDPTGAIEEEGGTTPTPSPPSQVTWLWRSNRRIIVNSGDVLGLLIDMWQLPVHTVEFTEESSFREVVATMQASALLVGMHGSALSNLIFMQDGAACVELLPFLYRYHPFMVLAKAYGILAWQWKNLKRKNALFDNNCFDDKKWSKFSVSKCWEMKACLRCVRDHAQTIVDLDLFRSTLEVVKTSVGEEVVRPS